MFKSIEGHLCLMNRQIRSKVIDSFAAESEVFQMLGKLKNQGAWKGKVVDLTVGSPDGPPEKEIIESLVKHAKNQDVHGYGNIAGEREFREQIAKWYRNVYQVELDPGCEVLPLVGSKRAMIDMAIDLVNPKRNVLIPEIGYPTYKIAAMIAGGVPFRYELDEENGYAPVFDSIEKNVLLNGDLMYLNYPQNPTGAIVEGDTFVEAVQLAKEFGFTICHDNAYGPISFDGIISPSFLQFDGAKDTGVEVFSFSKVFNMAGWRVACMVGSSEVIDIVRQTLVDYTAGIFTPIQYAASRALEIYFSHNIAHRQSQKYEKRRDFVVSLLEELDWSYFKPRGGFYIWARPPVEDTLPFVSRLFELTGVLVTPGVAYGPKGSKYIRIGLVHHEDLLIDAFDRIKKVGSALYENPV
jgi:LL-diaminopimelate aminotransferase